jgi:hypothetical protein
MKGGKCSYFLRLIAVRVTIRLTVSQSVSMSCCRAHFVDVWPDIASFSRVCVWNLLSCLCGAPSLTRGRVCHLSESESLYGWQSVSRSVCLGVEPTLWTFDQILLPFQESGSGIFVLSLWGALSDERPGLSFVNHSLVIVCVYIYNLHFCLSHLPHYAIHIIYTKPHLVPALYSRSCPTTH